MAVSFNGSSGLDCGNPAVLNFATNTTPFAMSMWMSLGTLTPSTQGAWMGRGFVSGVGTGYNFGVDQTVPGLTFASFDGTTSHGIITASASGVGTVSYASLGWTAINVFHHVYGEFTGTAWHLSIGGVDLGLNAIDTGAISNTAKFEIGTTDINGTPGQFAAGCVADAAVYSGPLTLTEITNLGNGTLRPSGVTSKTVLGYWPLDTLVNPEPDLSVNNNNGAFIGSPTLCANSPPYVTGAVTNYAVGPAAGPGIIKRVRMIGT